LVKIRWMGHACFEIKDKVTLVTDPHDGYSLGLPKPKAEADLVLISHSHFDHADGRSLVCKPNALIIDEPGFHNVLGVKVKGVKTYHDERRGAQRGVNIVYTFEMDGLKLCHAGDLGHILTDEQAAEVGSVDVLFIPVGGVYTIDARGANEVVKQLKPRVVIPMHYKVKGLTLPISGVEPFLKGKPRLKILDKLEYELTKETLPDEVEIVVFKPP